MTEARRKQLHERCLAGIDELEADLEHISGGDSNVKLNLLLNALYRAMCRHKANPMLVISNLCRMIMGEKGHL